MTRHPPRSTLFPYTPLSRPPGAIGRIPPYLANRFPATLVKFDVETEQPVRDERGFCVRSAANEIGEAIRSEEHTSELQSQSNLVCRLLLEKKKKLVNRHVDR